MRTEPADAQDVSFEVVDPDDPDAARLRGEMEQEASRLYHDRSGSIHATSAHAEELSPPSGGFIVARAGGRAIGCGGFKRFDDGVCEIKRMYLEPSWRGRGLAASLLDAIEDAARAAGYSVARLDTGDRQPAAERLYDGAGYRRIPDYNSNPLARHWFERQL